jgi:hypothetical protein
MRFLPTAAVWKGSKGALTSTLWIFGLENSTIGCKSIKTSLVRQLSLLVTTLSLMIFTLISPKYPHISKHNVAKSCESCQSHWKIMKKRFCYVVFNSNMLNATEVHLCKWCFRTKFFLLMRPIHVLPNARRRSVRALSLCNQNNIGSESTAFETVEQTWISIPRSRTQKEYASVP